VAFNRPEVANVLEHVQRQALRWSGFTSSHVPTAVGRLHVVEKRARGPRPTLCFLHGLSASSVQYAPLMRRLAPEHWRTLAVDMPAHGFSDVPRRGTDYQSLRDGLFEALDRLLAWNGPAVLFGNSMGGFAALRYAASRPERVKALVLVSPGGAPMTQKQFAELLDTFRLESRHDAVEFLDRLFAEPHPLRHLIAKPVMRQLQRAELQELIDAMNHHELLTPDEVAGLTMPIQFVWGDRDRILPKTSRDFFLEHLPQHARVALPADFGHSPQLEAPDEVAELSRAFFATLETGSERAA
jgi:pimeloyl-ACP methyl ester carboxylesterase